MTSTTKQATEASRHERLTRIKNTQGPFSKFITSRWMKMREQNDAKEDPYITSNKMLSPEDRVWAHHFLEDINMLRFIIERAKPTIIQRGTTIFAAFDPVVRMHKDLTNLDAVLFSSKEIAALADPAHVKFAFPKYFEQVAKAASAKRPTNQLDNVTKQPTGTGTGAPSLRKNAAEAVEGLTRALLQLYDAIPHAKGVLDDKPVEKVDHTLDFYCRKGGFKKIIAPDGTPSVSVDLEKAEDGHYILEQVQWMYKATRDENIIHLSNTATAALHTLLHEKSRLHLALSARTAFHSTPPPVYIDPATREAQERRREIASLSEGQRAMLWAAENWGAPLRGEMKRMEGWLVRRGSDTYGRVRREKGLVSEEEDEKARSE